MNTFSLSPEHTAALTSLVEGYLTSHDLIPSGMMAQVAVSFATSPTVELVFEGDALDAIFATKIDELPPGLLHLRLVNNLKKAGVHTLGQITRMTEAQFLKMRDVGKKTWWILREYLRERGVVGCSDKIAGLLEQEVYRSFSLTALGISDNLASEFQKLDWLHIVNVAYQPQDVLMSFVAMLDTSSRGYAPIYGSTDADRLRCLEDFLAKFGLKISG